jgi:hypothetical protein
MTAKAVAPYTLALKDKVYGASDKLTNEPQAVQPGADLGAGSGKTRDKTNSRG